MQPLIALSFLFAGAALASPTYEITRVGETQQLVAKGVKSAVVHPLTEGEFFALEKQADFDGDGVTDALLMSNCGGNGCPQSTYHFVTLRGGKLVLARIGEGTEARVRQQGSNWFVELAQADGAQVYVFAGQKAVAYATRTGVLLHPTVAVEGVAPHAQAGKRSFAVDVDLDGTPETIECSIWERWGSLLCTLPLPQGSQTLSTGCDRFGALATTAHGRREFVCNRDQVVRFDGQKWREPAPVE